MYLRSFVRMSAALAGIFVLTLSAHAQWTITTYKRAPQTPPPITSMAIADQYFSGAFPTRFTGSGTITQIDLFESGGQGQFTVNNPFPGVDQNIGANDTDDFAVRINGTLVVAADNNYNFFSDSDDGTQLFIDLDRDGMLEDATELVVDANYLQGSGNPGDTTQVDRSPNQMIPLTAGNYNFQVKFFERGGGGGVDVGYRRGTSPTALVLGAPQLGISLLAPAQVEVVGAAVGPAPPAINNFADAAVLRSAAQGPGFPATGTFDVFNIQDSGGDGDFLNDSGAPGLGGPNENDDDDFVVVGRGHLIVPAGGITGAVFRSNTDDGGRLLIDINRDGDFGDAGEFVINQDALQGDTNTDSAPVTLAAGRYATEYSWFERGGGGQGEVSVRLTAAGAFTLLGDDAAVAAGTGLQVALVPEPATVVLMALSLVGLACNLRGRK